jgi:predicted flap endonuclease-1-like 5' DNA nuclease
MIALQAHWPIVLAIVVVAVLLLVWLLTRRKRVPERAYRPDVLDEGAAPAQRNQALIDAAPPAAQFDLPPIIPGAAMETMAGLGEAIAFGAQKEVEESIAHEHEVAPEPAPAVETPAEPSGTDDLTRLKGVGPKLATLLASLGVTRYAQIAAWTDADLDALDTKLGAFAGRPRRDAWVDQARLLAGGDTAGYEAKFGKL